MKLLIQIFGLLMIVIGILLLIIANDILGWIANHLESNKLYIFAIIVRLLLGILFLAAAMQSKHPTVIKIFGYVAIVAAIALIFMGHENFQHFFSSLIAELQSYTPVSAIIVMVFGAYLFYAFTDGKKVSK